MDTILLKTEQDTKKLAIKIANDLDAKDVIALYGDLGAGKTTFARYLIKYLMDDDNLTVPSPTFTIVQSYETNDIDIYHFDLYRIKDELELEEIGFLESCHSGITLIEWPENAGNILPDVKYAIEFKFNGTNRIANVTNGDIL